MPDDIYTHGHAEPVLRSHNWRTAANSAGHLLEHLRPGMRLLDVGCGPGTITADLARLVAPGQVIGIDRSADVLELARAHYAGGGAGADAEAGADAGTEADAGAGAGEDAGARGAAEAGGLDNLVFAVGDAYGLDFEAGSFDVVHAHQILHHLSDPVAAIREMARVTAPGGLIALRETDYGARSWYPRLPELDQWHELYQAVARVNGAEPDAGRQLLAWAHAAGLTEAAASADVWCFATPSECAWWGNSWADRTTSTDFGAQATAMGLASPEQLERLADAWRRWAAHPDAYFTVPHGQILARPSTPAN